LNGLFLIDDTKDADSTNTHQNEPKEVKTGENDLKISEALANCNNLDDLTMLWDSLEQSEQNRFKPLFAKAKIKFTK
jgi:hypothetical protein